MAEYSAPDPGLGDTSATLRRTQFAYDGRTGEVAGIVLGNFLLSVPTIGFYRFWGKTRLRRYVWSHIEFHGERVEYTGTGLELFIGFLVGLAVLIPYVVLSAIAESQVESVDGLAIVRFINLSILFFLIHVAQYRARRYRLNRTSWRGIRGAQTGSAWRYGLLGIGFIALSIFTLGLAVPLGRTVLQNMRTSNTWFGDEQFEFKARARMLMAVWLICWLLLIPSLGLSYIWYRAKEFRVFAAHSRIAGLSFESNLSGLGLFRVGALFVLSLIVIAAIVWIPWIGVDMSGLFPDGIETANELPKDLMVPIMTSSILAVVGLMLLGSVQRLIAIQSLLPLIISRLTVVGSTDFDGIVQSQQEKLSRGEGLADAFDVGEF